MAITAQAFEREISVLHGEVEQTLMGAVRCKDEKTAERIEVMKSLTTQDWQTAARALLMARKTSLLDALDDACLEAVAFGHVDVRRSLFRVIEAADEHAAQRTVQEIAARRLNLRADDGDSAITRLETGLVCDALLEAYVMGANSRSA